MSRIGRKPVLIPDGVAVSITDDVLEVKGPKGALSIKFAEHIGVKQEGRQLIVSLVKETKQSRKMFGTTRSLIANMVEGVTRGFEKRLEIEGVGYKAGVQGGALELSLGFSHPVKVEPPAGIDFKVEKNVITVSGISKDDVGRTASKIRALKKPEPYKGKGIRYEWEIIRRKAGKRAITA